MRPFCVSAVFLLAFGATRASAQQFSYDGNRWYDIEISIFTNDVPDGGTRTEVPVARKLTAAYLPRLRELQTRSSAFMIEFPEDRGPELLPAIGDTPAVEPAVPLVIMGPIYSPAVRDSFKITDFDRDPFIDLDTRAAQFGSMNRSIDAAADHRLLWHKVWRQPMQGRAQTPAVFVSGGDAHTGHTELEGSLRIVDNAGGAMLDINVWLNEFPTGVVSATAGEREEWKIPALPFPLESEPVATMPGAAAAAFVPAAPTSQPIAVWQLAQTRELAGNQLYYLDHPALGVLIQIRPYLLPERILEGQEEF